MSMIYTVDFWKATGERVLRTALQTAIPLLGADGVGLFSLDWAQMGSVVAGASVLSLLTSVLSGLDGKGPAFTAAEVPPRVDDVGPVEEFEDAE